MTKTASKSATPAAVKTVPNEFRLVWLDMEMTGLDPEKERIIEVAVVVTEPDLTIVAEGPVLVIHQPDSLLDAMDSWNRSTHSKSGLTEKVKASTLTEEQAQNELITFFATTSMAKVLVFALIVVFLQVRPAGLFPQKGRMVEA